MARRCTNVVQELVNPLSSTAVSAAVREIHGLPQAEDEMTERSCEMHVSQVALRYRPGLIQSDLVGGNAGLAGSKARSPRRAEERVGVLVQTERGAFWLGKEVDETPTSYASGKKKRALA